MKLRASALLFVLGCVFLGSLAILLLFPGDITLSEQHGDASVWFSADRRAVFSRADCVSLTWNAENIREIYLNNDPTTGADGRLFCNSGDALPELRVVYLDGTVQVFTLPISVIIERGEVWIVLLAGIACWVTAGLVRVVGDRRERAASSPSGDSPSSRRITVFGVVGGVVIFAAVLAASGELLLRVYFGVFGTEDQRLSYVYSREEINEHRPLAIPLPTVGFGLSPFQSDVNSLGYRGEDVTLPKPSDVFRIVALGGSTTFGYTPVDQTYPADLQRILRETYGYTNVEVVNAGVVSYTTFNIVPNFMTRVLELEPDMAIFYEGVNDIHTRTVPPDCYRGMNALRGLNPDRLVPTDMTTAPLSASVLYRFISIRLGWEPDPLTLNSIFRNSIVPCDVESGGTPAENLAANPPIYYRRNLVSLIAIAQANDVQLVFSTWAYHQSDPAVPDFWPGAIVEHNQIVTDLAAQYGLPYIDYAPLAPQEDALWVDYIHMGVEGSLQQAETYAAFLVEQGLIPAPNPSP
ncbi:MAG: SGNH/GDSL hydrolase family protein [Anaerolineae bacterium]